MGFVLACIASDLASAKRQWAQVQEQGYRHDVAWSLYSNDPSVLVWARLLAKKTKIPIFFSNADRVNGPCFDGPTGGFNAGLALGFAYDSPVVVFQNNSHLHPTALEGLSFSSAESLAGACTGYCRDAMLWRDRVRRSFSSFFSGVVSVRHCLDELRCALYGGLFFDEPEVCIDSLFISPKAASNFCFSPDVLEPLYFYAETAYEYSVSVNASSRPWVEHRDAPEEDDSRFDAEWKKRQDAETLAWLVHSALSASKNRSPSDFLVDGLCAHSLYVPQVALDASVLEQVRRQFDSPLAKKTEPLCQSPSPPNTKILKRQAKAFFDAQAAWEQTLQIAVETDLAEKLRV